MKVSWTFSPDKYRGESPEISHAIADEQAIYVVGTIGDSPAAWKVDWNGKPLWRFDSRVDIQRGHWPTLGLGSLLVYDDGLYVLNPETGKHRKRWYLDSWGNSLSDDQRFYVVNTWHVAGPRVRVAALDATGKELWHRFPRGRVREDILDDVGALALDGGTLFYGADYRFAPGALVAALDPASGEPKWQQATHPRSAFSAACGKLFGIEKTDKKHQLVARLQSNGEKVWTAAVEDPSTQAPVVTGTTVVIESGAGIAAFECESGRSLWSAKDGARSVSRTPWATTMLVALGSETLVATRGRQVHVLRIADGTELWKSGPVASLGDLHSPVLVGERLLAVEGNRLVAFEPGQ